MEAHELDKLIINHKEFLEKGGFIVWPEKTKHEIDDLLTSKDGQKFFKEIEIRFCSYIDQPYFINGQALNFLAP